MNIKLEKPNQLFKVYGNHHSLKEVFKNNLSLDEAVVFAQQLKTANYYGVRIDPMNALEKEAKKVLA